MPSLYEYLNQQTNALPNYTDITGTPSLAGFIDRYKPSNVNTSLIADSLGNNSISLPNASSTLSYKAPTFTQSLGKFINRFNPMSSSPRTPAISGGWR